MTYKFLPSDFEGNNYSDNFDCAISRLAKRELGTPSPWVNSSSVYGDASIYPMKRWKISNPTLNGEPVESTISFPGFYPDQFMTIRLAIEKGTFKEATIDLEPTLP